MGRELMCLALMEDENITQLFYYLKQVHRRDIGGNECIENLFNYFEKYWINGFFTPDKWSHYGDDVRTTNELENWNSKIWKAGGRKKHNLYSLGAVLHKNAIRCLDNLKYAKPYYTKKAVITKKQKLDDNYAWYKNNPGSKYQALRRFVYDTTTEIRWRSPVRPWITVDEDLEDIESRLELDDDE